MTAPKDKVIHVLVRIPMETLMTDIDFGFLEILTEEEYLECIVHTS